jgi:predicted TIM-barrel fold metal-dependent hydrolase
MDAVGISRALVDEYTGWTADGRFLPGGLAANGAYRYTFAFAERAVERDPTRFAYLGRVDPDDPELEAIVSEMARRPGLLALRINPQPTTNEIEKFESGGYARLFAASQEENLPIFAWLPGSRLTMLTPYLDSFPDVVVIIDHLGVEMPRPDEAGAARYSRLDRTIAMARYKNVALKWSNAPSMSAEPYPFRDMTPLLRSAIEAFGCERVLWASDWTQHRRELSWAESLYWILDSADLARYEKEWVLGRTCRSMLRWDEKLEGGKHSGGA